MSRQLVARRRTLLAAAVTAALVPLMGAPAWAGSRPDVQRYHAPHRSSSRAATPAAVCTPRGTTDPDSGSDSVQDIDGDDANDLVVGEPELFANTPDNFGNGGVEALMSTSGTQRLIDGTFGADQTNLDDRWGSAVAMSDLDHDLCSDIVIGAPADAFAHGHITIVHGSPTGVKATPYTVQSAPTPLDGDLYGAAVAIARQPGDGVSTLWVGAPGSVVNGIKGAGAVYQYDVAGDGTLTLNQTITEESTLIGLTPVAGDHFGAVLYPEYDGGVTVGVPDRTVKGHAGAGMIVHIEGSYAAGPLPGAQVFTQDTVGVPGTAEAGDHFGAAVDYATVGVPGEDIGKIVDAGAIQSFTWTNTTPALMAPTTAADENSPGVPGTAEKGDRFGAAVSSAGGILCQEQETVFVGVPGEGIGRASKAGGVVALPVHTDDGDCAGTFLYEGHGLIGTPEKGDAAGSALSWVPDIEGQDEDTRDSLLIGIPGEDIGSVADAGVVDWFFGSGVDDFTAVHGPEKGLRFGAVLGQAPAGTVN